jgi:amino-acid N-acetyltransferase
MNAVTANARIAAIDAGDEVARLLTSCGLPDGDLYTTPALQLYGYLIDDRLAGVIGLECYRSVALLRSLAVAPAHRGLWLGAALMAHAERQADAQDVRALYLLTTGARSFFERFGYRVEQRCATPQAIRATAQFAGLCPESALVMVKPLLF